MWPASASSRGRPSKSGTTMWRGLASATDAVHASAATSAKRRTFERDMTLSPSSSVRRVGAIAELHVAPRVTARQNAVAAAAHVRVVLDRRRALMRDAAGDFLREAVVELSVVRDVDVRQIAADVRVRE